MAVHLSLTYFLLCQRWLGHPSLNNLWYNARNIQLKPGTSSRGIRNMLRGLGKMQQGTQGNLRRLHRGGILWAWRMHQVLEGRSRPSTVKVSLHWGSEVWMFLKLHSLRITIPSVGSPGLPSVHSQCDLFSCWFIRILYIWSTLILLLITHIKQRIYNFYFAYCEF